MFMHRDPAASSGLGPGRPHELRVDYQIADQEGLRPRGRGRVPLGPCSGQRGTPRTCLLAVLCLTDVFSFHVPLWRWLHGFSPTAA